MSIIYACICSFIHPWYTSVSCNIAVIIDYSILKFPCAGFETSTVHIKGYPVAQLVEALRYKSEGRGFYSRWNFSLT